MLMTQIHSWESSSEKLESFIEIILINISHCPHKKLFPFHPSFKAGFPLSYFACLRRTFHKWKSETVWTPAPNFCAWSAKFRTWSWRSGHCYLNKAECNLNQSKDDSFVERVAKSDSWNNGDRHKINEIFVINCFVFVITLVWRTVHRSAMTQTAANLMEKTLQLTVPR